MTILEYKTIKIFLQKDTFQIGLKKFLWLLQKLTICHFNREEIIGTCYQKELQKTNQKVFKIEKVIKRKDDELYVEREGYNSPFNS